MKKWISLFCAAALTAVLITGCGSQTAPSGQQDASAASRTGQEEAGSPANIQTESAALEDGTYAADFETDSSMFHVSEACNGKGTLIVKNGEMVIHISLTSKNIVNLFPGTAEDAQKEGAALLQPTVDTVTYEDGISEEVNGFDVPVPALDEPFALALVGGKGKWYDHEVTVSNPEKLE